MRNCHNAVRIGVKPLPDPHAFILWDYTTDRWSADWAFGQNVICTTNLSHPKTISLFTEPWLSLCNQAAWILTGLNQELKTTVLVSCWGEVFGDTLPKIERQEIDHIHLSNVNMGFWFIGQISECTGFRVSVLCWQPVINENSQLRLYL